MKEITDILHKECPNMSIELIDWLADNHAILKSKLWCPYCDKAHKAWNGIGPENFVVDGKDYGPLIRKTLKRVPVLDWINRTACPIHDWMSKWGYGCGATFGQWNEAFRKFVELDLNYGADEKIRKSRWYSRWYWRWMKRRVLIYLDDICKLAVSSDKTKEDYENTSCRV